MLDRIAASGIRSELQEHGSAGSLSLHGIPLPPHKIRRGGPAREDDDAYVASAVKQVSMLRRLCGVGPHSRIVDIGCGQARLLYGLLQELGTLGRYVGIDVDERSIRWLRENVSSRLPVAEFRHINYHNSRYNRAGMRDLEFPDVGQFDCAVLLSVFTHMRLRDIKRYMALLPSLVVPGGSVLLSAHVEDDVPPETENPEGYYLGEWKGALHCVRLNRESFEKLVRKNGFEVSHRDHRPNKLSYYALKR